MIEPPLLASKKDIIIVHPFIDSEIQDPVFGGARLISEQANFLRQKGHEVYMISLAEVAGLASSFYKFEARMRARSSSSSIVRRSEGRRWIMNAIARIAEGFLTSIDPQFISGLRKKLRHHRQNSLIIYHYPYGFGALLRSMNRMENSAAICEHNVEWQFLQSNMGLGFISRLLVKICKKIEVSSLKSADSIIILSNKDRAELEKVGIKNEKMVLWLPIVEYSTEFRTASAKVDGNYHGKFVVGFLGSNFGPNVAAVENIIKIANEVIDTNLLFLILGNVSDAFRDRTLPKNIKLLGYVEDIAQHLAYCSAFLNPKSTSETGVEIKMLDYLKFGKPIITTKEGAHGFEDYQDVTISDLDAIPDILEGLANTLS